MKERRTYNILQSLFILLCGMVMLCGAARVALADVAVGDVIDKTNWQKAQGLLPQALLDYLQKGYFTITVGKLNYDPRDVLPDEYKANMQKNNGRYGITSKGELIDKKTGKVDPMDVIGIPFPELDVKDPRFSEMIGFNNYYNFAARGTVAMTNFTHFVGKKYERSILSEEWTMSVIGTADNIAMQPLFRAFGKGELSQVLLSRVIEPFELNGISSLSYSYQDQTPDKMFAYVPALRRVRTTSAASKSSAMLGSDYALDDACGGFMGKPRDFNCKYLRTQDGLINFLSSDIIPMVKKPDGSYEIKKPFKSTVWGYETPGWQGKPWAPTNHIWVKEKVHVIECTAKDPYYAYGKFELWYAPRMFGWVNKTIWDKAGKRWKAIVPGFAAVKSADGVVGKMEAQAGDLIYDERRDHATLVDQYTVKCRTIFHAVFAADNFTAGGMTKISK